MIRGRFGAPCPRCEVNQVQRIRYADSETLLRSPPGRSKIQVNRGFLPNEKRLARDA